MAIMFVFSTMFLIAFLLIGVGIDLYALKKHNKKEKIMIKCPDCGKRVSINADKCPRCYSEVLKDKETTRELVEKNDIKSEALIKKIILWIYQIICGISILFIFEKMDSFINQLIILLALIINTITIIIFSTNSFKNGTNFKEKISIISILAIICGIFFSLNYTIVLINHSRIGYNEGVREIMYLEIYTKKEAEEFLKNIYYALRENEYNDDNVELYRIWEDRNKPNEYYANFRVPSEGAYLPANATKIVVNQYDKTKIERIYWQFNDNIEIDFYKDGNQVEEFIYVYHCAIIDKEPNYPIKDYFEEEVKEKLKSPSSAIFTYNQLKYSPSEKRFKIYGWVEGQNSFGAMVKEDFILTLKPCKKDYCDWYSLDYTWKFN